MRKMWIDTKVRDGNGILRFWNTDRAYRAILLDPNGPR